ANVRREPPIRTPADVLKDLAEATRYNHKRHLGARSMARHHPWNAARSPRQPVKRRTRTFRPNYLSFAGTYQCNLTCPHCCVPIEWTDRLDLAVALGFLEDAHSYGIGILGFTGGEPFLYPEFVLALCRRAAALGFRFDKIMTNGLWFRDPPHLEGVLSELAGSGFSGKLGLSVDK